MMTMGEGGAPLAATKSDSSFLISAPVTHANIPKTADPGHVRLGPSPPSPLRLIDGYHYFNAELPAASFESLNAYNWLPLLRPQLVPHLWPPERL